MLRILKPEDFRTTNWSGGKTTEMLIWPIDGNYGERNFDWRISSATVEIEESDFSDLTGFNRFLTVLDGKLLLDHGDEVEHEIRGLKVYEFDGGKKTHCVGCARDFNLIHKKELNALMGRKEIAEHEHIQPETPVCGYLVVFVASGEVDIRFGNKEYFSIGENTIVMADKLDDETDMNIYAKKKSDLIICSIGE